MTDAAAPEPVQPAYRVLQVGDPVPWFKQNSTSNPNFSFDTVAGRYIVLCFYGMGSDEVGRATLASFQEEHRSVFDDKIALFGVSVDPRTSPRAAPGRSSRASAISGISTARSGASTAPCRATSSRGRDPSRSAASGWC